MSVYDCCLGNGEAWSLATRAGRCGCETDVFDGAASPCEPLHAYFSLDFIRLSGVLPMSRALSEIIVCM